MANAKTLVVGIGEVGGALATVLERTYPVIRHDLEPVRINDPVDVMHLCLPFQSLEHYKSAALEYIRRFNPSLVIINSTVQPGATRAIAQASEVPVAFSPVRGKHTKMTEDIVRYCKFVAAGDAQTAGRAEEHFERAGIRTRRMNRIETLELAKLAETTYFGLLISYAQELNRYCESVDADYYQATEFFDEIDFLPRVRYFPGFIGGHCVIPNINLLLGMAPSPMLEMILDSNRRRARELESAQTPEPVKVEASAPGTVNGR